MYNVFTDLLKAKGCTSYQVSKATGISTATLTAWKQGKYTPKPEKIKLIADFFGVDISVFYGKKEDGDKIVLRGNIADLVQQAEQASPEDVRLVTEYLSRLNKAREGTEKGRGNV